jgi:hypothetical protein
MTLKYLLGIVLLASCSPKDNQQSNPVKAKNSSIDTFKYKPLSPEPFIDTLRQEEINVLYGTWLISEISKTGGSSINEQLVHQQIGKRLQLGENAVIFDFLGETDTISKPSFEIDFLVKDENSSRQTLEGSTLFYGYGGECRKRAPRLIINNKLFFEVLNFTEMSCYYDGLIFFLTKQ